MTGDRALLSNVVEKAGPLVTFGDNSKGLSEGYGCFLQWLSFIESHEVKNPQLISQIVKTNTETEATNTLLPLNEVLGEDTDPKAVCQWSVSTSPGLNPLDASADSGSDIDSSDEFNKDGDLRTPIAPPVTSLRMAKVIFLAGTAEFWSYERSDTLVRMSVNTSGEKSETHVRTIIMNITFDHDLLRHDPPNISGGGSIGPE
ncbi:hypothetical protein AgCh_036468 [Apium graveolens]